MSMSELKKQRLLKGLTQIHVSKKTGIHHSTLSLIENGWQKPTADQILRLVKALEIDKEILFPKE